MRTVCLVLTEVGYKDGGTNERYTGEKVRDEAKGEREWHFDEIRYRRTNEERLRGVETNRCLID